MALSTVCGEAAASIRATADAVSGARREHRLD
jgi:hypothetical protein